jgi:hypothetical protein
MKFPPRTDVEPGLTPILLRWTVLLCLLVLIGFLRCQGASVPACDEPNFLLRRYPVGPSLTSAVVADFNGDGKADLAVSGFRQNAPGTIGYLHVLLGQGDGSLLVLTNYSLGSLSSVTTKIAAGDLNKDGKVDLALILESSTGSILVWLGNGDGTLQSSRQYFATGNVQSLSIADVNRDAKLDLVVATDGAVSTLLGNGDGTFHGAIKSTGAAGSSGMHVADFDRDGKLDVVVTGPDNSVSILLGQGDGAFQKKSNYVAGVFARSVTSGDFDGDGILDLAVAGMQEQFPSPASVSILPGIGDGAFKSPAKYPIAVGLPQSVAVADFNADGIPDLAVGADTGFHIFTGRGNGAFEPDFWLRGGGYATSVGVGDFDGDGKPDVVSSDFNGGAAYVLLNHCGALPDLAVERRDSTMTISWPYPSSNYLLQSTTTLNPASWQSVALTNRFIGNGRWNLGVTPEQRVRFYRLQKP